MKRLLIAIIGFMCYIQTANAKDAAAIENFDSNKYLGKWYEIARLPNRFEDKCIAPITALYSTDPDNKGKIFVTNTCNTRENTPDIAEGIATFAESTSVAKLKVTFLPRLLRWLPFGHADYWVLDVDYDKLAIVGSPDRKYLWILARTENVTESDINNALTIAEEQEFDTSKLIYNYAQPR